ncbi:ArnT family glycosyltransferase [Persephonella sp.]
MKKALLVALLLGIIGLIAGSYSYRFRGEEPTRVVMAFEMEYFGSYAQPTYLGENYYRKPPLFNWLAIFSSKLWGWNQFTGRFVSIVSTVLVLILIYLFSYRFVFKGEQLPSLMSAAAFLGFIDVVFWYGFLSEIDMTLTFFVFGTIFSLFIAFETASIIYFAIAGLLTGFSFLLKGFPAPVFFAVTYTVLAGVYFFKSRQHFFRYIVGLIAAILSGFIPVAVWVYSLPDPEKYISVLWRESFGRVKASTDITKFFYHLVYYPVLNIKQTLLVSAVLLVFAVFNFRSVIRGLVDRGILPVVLVFVVNYIPYWISAGARGRYILPILPLFAVIGIYFIWNYGGKKLKNVLLGVLIFTFVVRIGVGLFYFPYETEKKGLYLKISGDMKKVIAPAYYGKIASNCDVHKGLIYYVDAFSGKPVLSERKLPDWNYFIDCKGKLAGKPVRVYDYKGQKIRLFFRE